MPNILRGASRRRHELKTTCSHSKFRSLLMLPYAHALPRSAETLYTAAIMNADSTSTTARASRACLMIASDHGAARALGDGETTELQVRQTRAVERIRYNGALHSRLTEKLDELGIELPPLCACPHGTHPLDSSYPFKCGRNCPLFRSPDRYAASLNQVLYAYGVLE